MPRSGPFVTREQNPYVAEATVGSGFLSRMSELTPQREQAARSRRGVYNSRLSSRCSAKKDLRQVRVPHSHHIPGEHRTLSSANRIVGVRLERGTNTSIRILDLFKNCVVPTRLNPGR